MCDPTSSYATAGIALRVSGVLKPHYHDKVETRAVGRFQINETNIRKSPQLWAQSKKNYISFKAQKLRASRSFTKLGFQVSTVFHLYRDLPAALFVLGGVVFSVSYAFHATNERSCLEAPTIHILNVFGIYWIIEALLKYVNISR
jgi:hypothetical protein